MKRNWGIPSNDYEDDGLYRESDIGGGGCGLVIIGSIACWAVLLGTVLAYGAWRGWWG